jgi:hypothetical protein
MSESILQRGTEVQELTTAILLPNAGLFADRGGRGLSDIGPLTRLGGLSLFQRTVLTLQRAGIRQMIVLAGSEEGLLKQALRRGPRVTIPVRWMPIREFPLSDSRTWEALATEIHGFCLIAGAQAVFPKGLIEQLRHALQDGQALIVTRTSSDREPHVGRRNPAVEMRDDRLVSFHNQTGFETSQIAADLVVLPAGVLAGAGTAPALETHSESGSGIPIRRWLERAASENRVRVLPTAADVGVWYRDVWDQSSAKSAERTLFQSLKGEY